MEEAAVIAQEYISSLDNLPSEVNHLLEEIADRENKIQDILSEIHSKGSSYIRHTLSGQPLTAKDLTIPQRVMANYDRVRALSEEKVVLSNRIVSLVSKASGRLDVELGRLLTTSGDTLPGEPFFPGGSRTDISKLGETLRAAMDMPDISPPYTGPSSAPPLKRRRFNTSAAASPSPSVHAGRGRRHHTSRSPAVLRRGQSSAHMDVDEEDAEGEEEEVDDGGDEDNTPYCICKTKSYGEMIACDNPGCPTEWFHMHCMGLSPPLPDRWYCPECAPNVATKLSDGQERRKRGRK